MNRDTLTSELQTSAKIYGMLLALTVLTVALSLWDTARALVVVVALSVASVKGMLIAWHFMHMKDERPIIWMIMLTGIVSILILVIGIFPDLARRLP